MKLYVNQFISNLQAYIHNKLFPSSEHGKLGISFLIIGLCLGFAVRSGMLWFIDPNFDSGDAASYLVDAQKWIAYFSNFSDDNTINYPENYRPPLYALFLAVIISVFGKNVFALQLTQIVMSLVATLLITRVAANRAPNTAPWVFGAMLLSPFEAVFTTVALSETLTMFLITAAAFAIFTYDGMRRWIIGGILFGLTALTRDIYLPLVLLVAISWIVLGKGSIRIRFFSACILIASTCLVVLPWTLRNYVVTDQFVPVSEGRLGFSIWMGSWAINGDFTRGDATGQRIYPTEAFRNQVEMDLMHEALSLFEQGKRREADRVFRSLAIQRIQDEPFTVIGKYFMRAPRLWLGTRFDIFQLNQKWFPRESRVWTMAKITLWGLNSVIILLGIVGIFLALRRRHPVSILIIPILYTAIVYFPLNSFENRYSQPVYPFVIIFAVFTLISFTDKLRTTNYFIEK